jgi:hypothetical protein
MMQDDKKEREKKEKEREKATDAKPHKKNKRLASVPLAYSAAKYAALFGIANTRTLGLGLLPDCGAARGQVSAVRSLACT